MLVGTQLWKAVMESAQLSWDGHRAVLPVLVLLPVFNDPLQSLVTIFHTQLQPRHVTSHVGIMQSAPQATACCSVNFGIGCHRRPAGAI